MYRTAWLLPPALLTVALLTLASCDRSAEKPKREETPPAHTPATPGAPVEVHTPVVTPLPVAVEPIPPVIVGTEVRRNGDEMVVAGRYFRTGTRVVLWTDPGGYDGYRTERRFAPWAEAPFAPATRTQPAPKGQPDRPARYGLREWSLNWPELEAVRGGGWPLELLKQKIDQFVLHYDVVGTSEACFHTLHDDRGLSIHFMLDVDGTIYQTLDVKERAFHATVSNPRSIGIEIANRGAYESEIPLKEFYAKDAAGTRVALPERFGDGGIRVPGIYRPDRPSLVRGSINGLNLVMYDFTPQQYEALTHLTAALATVLPKITVDYPRDRSGDVVTQKLPDARLATYQGILAHFHIQDNKYDPGPAFQWDRVIKGARALMTEEALSENNRARNSPVRPGPLSTRPTVPEPAAAEPSSSRTAPPRPRR